MNNFWNAVDNLRVSLVQEERAGELQRLCRRETHDADSQTLSSLDLDLALDGNDTTATGTTEAKSKEEMIALVEGTILKVLEAIAKGHPPSLVYRRRDTWANVRFSEGRGLEMKDDPLETTLRFDNLPSLKRFALTIKLLSVIHRLLQTNTYCTKRDLYYQDPQTFGSQSCLDAIVDNISCMFRVPRACLHVLTTSKGLVCGDLRYTDLDGSRVDCRNASSMVPSHVEAIKDLQSDARFVLIVEKDATFQRLIDDQFCHKLAPCIMITAKGFPDVNTRLLVRRLWDTIHVPVLALVDADPYGMEIMMVYKFGSRSLSFDTSNMAVPIVRWLGVWPSDITRLNVPRSALIPLTQSDVRKAHELLKRPYMTAVPTWRTELETLLESGVKAEIQCLDSISAHFLTDVYLPNKVCYGGWI